jgi:DNA polymerase
MPDRILHIDFESRSPIDLRKTGVYVYAEHPQTDVWLAAYGFDDDPVKLWYAGAPVPQDLADHVKAGGLIYAHNAQFERVMWAKILTPRYGWPLPESRQWRCTMAQALACALPGSLDKVADALDLEPRKDKEGARLMRLMSKPRRPRKGEDPAPMICNGCGSTEMLDELRARHPGAIACCPEREMVPRYYWHDEPEKLTRLGEYCATDIKVERALYRRLPPLSESEQELWQLDAVINARGFAVNSELLEAAARVAARVGQEMQDELARITDGVVTSANKVAALLTWLNGRGCDLSNLRKGTLRAELERTNLDPAARRAMELRLAAAHDVKVNTMLTWRCADGRIRGTLQYHGAATGRFASRGAAMQNLKRDAGDVDEKVAAILAGDVSRYPQPLAAIAEAARGAIVAAPGCRLLIGDFSGVESRVLAWIAREKPKLNQWRKFDATGDPRDEPYYLLGEALGLPREIGKVCDLAFGYAGGIDAYANLTHAGDTSTEAERETFKEVWRSKHPRTVSFWRASKRAAISVVNKPKGTRAHVNSVTFERDNDFLKMTLPSGRIIRYPFPEIIHRPSAYSDGNYATLSFMDTAFGKWAPVRFGNGVSAGLLTENIVQGVARDLLAEAMKRLEAAGYAIVLTVHDEIVAEVPIGFGSLDEFRRLLVAAPAWAADLPIAAKCREGARYSKPAADDDAGTVADDDDASTVADDDDASTVADDDADDFEVLDDVEVLDDEAEEVDVGQAPANAPEDVHAAESTPPFTFESVPPPTPEQIRAAIDQAEAAFDRAPPGEAPGRGNGRAAGNGHDPHAFGNGLDADALHISGSAADRSSEQQGDKPYGSIRAALLAKGYRLARSFPFMVPGESEPLFFEDRFELPPSIAPSPERPSKTYRFRHRDNGRELNGTGPRRIIYRWPAILAAGPGATIFITEGANKSEPLNGAGLLATAAPYHQWTPECAGALAGRHLIYLEDHDHPDAKGVIRAKLYSADARARLASGAASFRIVPALHLWRDLGRNGEPPHGWDSKDWQEAGGNPARLPELCQAIPADGDKSHDPLFWHGEPDPRPQMKWRIKRLMPAVGVGLLAGQWGTYKTFMAIELAMSVIAAGQRFCDRPVSEPCGVLILAAEGGYEIRDRVNAAVQAKHPDLAPAPITWRESCPILLADDAADQLIRIIQEASEGCLTRFKMPIGLVIIDVLTNAAGYAKAGDENDPAIGARIMGALRRAAEACRCFVLPLDHFGKSIEAGTRGTSAKEGAADVIFACLGEREVSGTVVNTRLALRKVRSGPQGQEFPFRSRLVPIPERSDDAEGPETTCVIEWEAAGTAPRSDGDPWEANRRADTKLAMRALRRAMMKLLADHGIDFEPERGYPTVRAIDEELVRQEFYASVVADEGTPEQKLAAKSRQFRRTRDRAEQQGLIGRREIEGQAYLWLLA